MRPPETNVMPALSLKIEMGKLKLVPVIVIVTVVPGAPLLGLMAVIVGGGVAVPIVKTSALLVPAAVFTVMFAVPVAPAAIAKVAFA